MTEKNGDKKALQNYLRLRGYRDKDMYIPK
jgi:hypothetical protein